MELRLTRGRTAADLIVPHIPDYFRRRKTFSSTVRITLTTKLVTHGK
jgi:hypothetical protein